MKDFALNGLLGAAVILFATPALQAGEASVQVKVDTITERTVAARLPAYGVIQPNADKVAVVSLSHAGIITKVWSRLGQRVKRGDLLLELETAPSATMEYLQAKAAVDFANGELARKRRLLKEQLATQADVEAARKALTDAKTALASLRAQGKGRTSSRLRAPIDGVVIALNVKQGQRIQANSTAVLLAPKNWLVAQLGVEPEDSTFVAPGQAVEISSVFAPGIVVRSQVQEVHAMINTTTRLVDVLVPIPPKQTAPFIPGMRVVATIYLSKERTLAVPRSALLEDGNGHYLYRVQGRKAQKVYVTPGIDQGSFVSVSGAIKAGDKVVVTGNYELQDGMAVREVP